MAEQAHLSKKVRQIVPLLARSFRVLTYGPLMADDLAAFVQALGLNKLLLCGFSDGAQIALECGMRYPDLANALIVCGAAYNVTEQYANVAPL